MVLVAVVAVALAGPGGALPIPEDTAVAGVTAVDLGRRGCVLLVHERVMMYVHGGPIVVTRDRGRTWAPAGRFDGVIQQVRVLDADTAFLLWEWQIEGVYPGLTATRDGGRAWIDLPLDQAARRSGECCFQEVGTLRVASADELAVSLDGYGWLASLDGGQTWQDVPGADWPDHSREGAGGRVCRVQDRPDAVVVEVRRRGRWRSVGTLPKAADGFDVE